MSKYEMEMYGMIMKEAETYKGVAADDQLDSVEHEMFNKKGSLVEEPNNNKRFSDSTINHIEGSDLLFSPFNEEITSDSLEVARSKINGYLVNREIDFNSPNANTFMGYCFRDTTSALFKLELVIVGTEKKLNVRCIRFEGDAFVLNQFFTDLITQCGWFNPSLEVQEEEKDGDYVDPFADSDDEADEADEDQDDDLNLSDFKYLDLEYDSKVVMHWVQSLKSSSVQETISILLLMCFNTHKQSNLEIMSKVSVSIIDAVMFIMKNPEASLREIYGCCYLLTRLNTTKNCNLKSGELQVIVDCLVRWSIVGGQETSWKMPVPVSNNIQRSCALLLQDLVQNTSEINTKQLQKVIRHEETAKDVTQILSKIVNKRADYRPVVHVI